MHFLVYNICIKSLSFLLSLHSLEIICHCCMIPCHFGVTLFFHPHIHCTSEPHGITYFIRAYSTLYCLNNDTRTNIKCCPVMVVRKRWCEFRKSQTKSNNYIKSLSTSSNLSFGNRLYLTLAASEKSKPHLSVLLKAALIRAAGVKGNLLGQGVSLAVQYRHMGLVDDKASGQMNYLAKWNASREREIVGWSLLRSPSTG